MKRMRLEMIEQLTAMPKYEAYEDSGVKWIGEIPAHWGSTSSKRLLEMPITDGPHSTPQLFDEGIPFISAEAIKNGVINFDSKRGYISEKDYQEFSRKYIPQRNDVYMVKSGATTGRVAKVETDEKFTIWSPLAVFRSKQSTLQSSFLYYFLSSPSFQKGIELSWSFGTQQNIGMGVLGNLPLCYPPLSEQTTITAFLDSKTAQIDQAMAIKEQQIALLKERKQILIQNAVTRGLSPDAPMRDSGVEWIGEIPEHWEILANRALFKERIEPGEDGLLLLSVSIHTAVSSEEIPEDENIRGRIKIEDKSKYNLVQPGDIVFNMMRAWQGAIGAVKVKGMVSPAYIIAVPNEKIVSSYFEYQYRCPEFIQQMDRNSKGITDFRKRLYWGEFKQLLTVVPPTEEQVAIVAHIEIESTKIDRAISLQQQQIDKLKEYKATLINNAVTGKVRVPELDESSMPELVDSLVA
jgi:type I restriction enzyme S subunit